jgi:hypothetical protein
METTMHKKAFRIPIMIFMGIIALFGGSIVAMLLWNALLPGLFHFPVITFWQTMGLLLLSRLIFGFGCHNGHGHRGAGLGHWHRNIDKLTPEEKEKLFHRMWDDDCCHPPHGWGRDRFSDEPEQQK